MKKIGVSVLILIALVMLAGPALSRIRCGWDLISVGDTAMDVKFKLGRCESQILGRQVTEARGTGRVEYETNTQARVYMQTTAEERWSIRVLEGTHYYCYSLLFARGRLEKIEGWQQCD